VLGFAPFSSPLRSPGLSPRIRCARRGRPCRCHPREFRIEVRGGLYFVPVNSMAPAERRFAPGETVTLQVVRSFATQKGLVE
jgi:hypothetical protein